MTTKRKIQIVVDLCMILLLPLLMAYNLISELAHECFGIAMVLLFLCHHLLNETDSIPQPSWGNNRCRWR